MAKKCQVAMDCADPKAQANFWAQALDYILEPPPPGFASWEDALKSMGVPEEEWNTGSSIVDPDGVEVRIFFQKVPEGKHGKNRLHLDIKLNGDYAGRPVEVRKNVVETEVTRLTALGAKILYRLEEGSHYHVTMADPEGNEFCVC